MKTDCPHTTPGQKLCVVRIPLMVGTHNPSVYHRGVKDEDRACPTLVGASSTISE
jgi:hypothetical protein